TTAKPSVSKSNISFRVMLVALGESGIRSMQNLVAQRSSKSQTPNTSESPISKLQPTTFQAQSHTSVDDIGAEPLEIVAWAFLGGWRLETWCLFITSAPL